MFEIGTDDGIRTRSRVIDSHLSFPDEPVDIKLVRVVGFEPTSSQFQTEPLFHIASHPDNLVERAGFEPAMLSRLIYSQMV